MRANERFADVNIPSASECCTIMVWAAKAQMGKAIRLDSAEM